MRLFTGFFLFLLLASSAAIAQTARAEYEAATIAAADGDFERAGCLYRAALEKLGPRADRMLTARINHNIGVALYRTGRAGDSLPFYEKAIRISGGKYTRAFYSLGMALAETGDHRAAADAFEHYLAKVPRDGEAWFDLGLARYSAGDDAGAKAAFARSLERGTVAASDALNNIGVVMAREGDIAGAVRNFEAAIIRSNGVNTTAAANLRICGERNQTVGLTISNIGRILNNNE